MATTIDKAVEAKEEICFKLRVVEAGLDRMHETIVAQQMYIDELLEPIHE